MNSLATKQQTQIPVNWSTPPTPNEIIHAWDTGVEHGKAAQSELVKKEFNTNIDKALNLASEFFEQEKDAIGFQKMYVRASSWTSFEVLMIIDHSNYLTEKRNEAYKIARRLKKQAKSDFFSMEFIFMPSSDSVDSMAIACDGFVYEYGKKK